MWSDMVIPLINIKGKFLDGFKSLYNNGDLKFPYDLECPNSPDDFAFFIDDLYLKDWIVFSKPVFKCSNHVIKYLGRYTHRVANIELYQRMILRLLFPILIIRMVVRKSL